MQRVELMDGHREVVSGRTVGESRLAQGVPRTN